MTGRTNTGLAGEKIYEYSCCQSEANGANVGENCGDYKASAAAQAPQTGEQDGGLGFVIVLVVIVILSIIGGVVACCLCGCCGSKKSEVAVVNSAPAHAWAAPTTAAAAHHPVAVGQPVAAVAQPAVSAAQPATISVQVPAGAKDGQQLQVQGPNGMLNVIVPVGAVPGQIIQLQAPSPQPVAASVVVASTGNSNASS